MGATIYEVDSSHVPMLSKPKRVIDVLKAQQQEIAALRAQLKTQAALIQKVNDKIEMNEGGFQLVSNR